MTSLARRAAQAAALAALAALTLAAPASAIDAVSQAPQDNGGHVLCQHAVTVDRTIPGNGTVSMLGRTFKAGTRVVAHREWAHEPGTRGQACGNEFNTHGVFRQVGDLAAMNKRVWGRFGGLLLPNGAPARWRDGHYGHSARAYAVSCTTDPDGRITTCNEDALLPIAMQVYTVTVTGGNVNAGWDVSAF